MLIKIFYKQKCVFHLKVLNCCFKLTENDVQYHTIVSKRDLNPQTSDRWWDALTMHFSLLSASVDIVKFVKWYEPEIWYK